MGHSLGGQSYELIELKYKSDQPLFAAMEIIQYGTLYVFTRVHLLEHYQNKPLLKAESIGLRVLAPKKYYQHPKNGPYNFSDLERILSCGITKFADAFVPRLKMDFKLTAFQNDFEWPCGDDELPCVLKKSRRSTTAIPDRYVH